MDFEVIDEDLKRKVKKSGRFIIIGILVVLAALLASSGFYTVSEQEKAVVTTAGRISGITDAGLRFRIPFIQRAEKVNITTRGMEVGYLSNDGNVYADSNESLMITNDFNIVAVDFYVEWRVVEPDRYLYAVDDPRTMLYNCIQSSARDVISMYKVDSVLTDGKMEIQANIRERINNVLHEYNCGLQVTNVTIQDAEPPTDEVIAAFKAVEDAKQRKDTMLNEANRYYNENIPNARAESDRIVKAAEAVREARVNEARGQVARFNEMYAEYANNPDITKSRMYLETMEEIMPDLKVIVDGGESSGSILKILDLNQ